MLLLDRYRSAEQFLAAAGAWLAAREAEHNLVLGIASGLGRDEATDDGSPYYFALVRSDGRPVAAAMRTPPWNLLLSEVDEPPALGLLAEDLAGDVLPGVTGPPDAVERFSRTWQELCGGRAEVVMDEGVYRLTHVRAPRGVPGAPRRAAEGDRGLLSEWLMAFQQEAMPTEDGGRMRAMIAAWDPGGERQFWLWEVEGRPASVVGAGSRTPNGIRIGPVYTPPSHRGHGFASALTAAVSQWNLEQGRRFCFLYTNLANATANHIYQDIGYERVTDARMVRFVTGEGAGG